MGVRVRVTWIERSAAAAEGAGGVRRGFLPPYSPCERHLLPKKFDARIRTATAAELDRWALRLLDAATLAEVFANE